MKPCRKNLSLIEQRSDGNAVCAKQWQRARDLVLHYGWNAMAYQILNPGMQLWLDPDHDAVAGYVSHAGYRVVAGAPICAFEELPAVTAAFADDTRLACQRVCYFGIQDRLIALLSEQGPLTRFLIGAQPVWRPASWQRIIVQKASIRAQVLRARNKQVMVSSWPAELAANHVDLIRCRDEWLATRGLSPLHFLIETDTLGNLADRKIFVAERAGRVIGFLVASPVPLRNGWLVEQIIRGREAPNGTTELLLDAAMRDFTANGADYVTLGLSPLSRRAEFSRTPQPLWTRLLFAGTRWCGHYFYNFDGLDAFKAKFAPDLWEPLYAVTLGKNGGIGAFYAIAGVFGGMPPTQLIGRAIVRKLAHTIRPIDRRLPSMLLAQLDTLRMVAQLSIWRERS
ncbi:MAG: DUF2156 domain-containing protein [Chloroflexales bacterium]|nr:DUF2156 domain-containing protein [Chloroflexales bacterium]